MLPELAWPSRKVSPQQGPCESHEKDHLCSQMMLVISSTLRVACWENVKKALSSMTAAAAVLRSTLPESFFQTSL